MSTLLAHTSAETLADSLVESLITQKQSHRLYDQSFIELVAACPELKRMEVERRLQAVFKADLRLKEWRLRIKVAAERLTPQSTQDEPAWRSELIRSEDGRVLSRLHNASLMLKHHPDWMGVLGYNEFDGRVIIRSDPPSPCTGIPGNEIDDNFETAATQWLEKQGLTLKADGVHRVIDQAAHFGTWHPVRDYLSSLPEWDRVLRLGTWLIDYLGVESSDEKPNRYAMAVGEKFLISAIARVMRPGCKCDHMLILEGEQGILKSTALRVLTGDEWFTDQVSDFGSKDASIQLRGTWIAEISELSAILSKRAEMDKVKAFISQQDDRFRPPYGRRLVRVPRQCVFSATTNRDTWLGDDTGGRRFWPVRCTRINIEALKADRDQIWAEALYLFRQDAIWWLDDKDITREAVEEQRGRMLDDAWQYEVEQFANEEAAKQWPSGGTKGSVSVQEVLARLIPDVGRRDQMAVNRVAKCLRTAGWERYQQRLPREVAILRGTWKEWRYRVKTVTSQ